MCRDGGCGEFADPYLSTKLVKAKEHVSELAGKRFKAYATQRSVVAEAEKHLANASNTRALEHVYVEAYKRGVIDALGEVESRGLLM
jgi:hypothetical protein